MGQRLVEVRRDGKGLDCYVCMNAHSVYLLCALPKSVAKSKLGHEQQAVDRILTVRRTFDVTFTSCSSEFPGARENPI